MENASKALLIAGSMLFAIIIASLLMMMWNNMQDFSKSQEQIQEAKKLADFNKKYESYAKNGVRGTDVVTVINMALDNNNKYPDMQITVNFTLNTDLEVIVKKYKLGNGNKWEEDPSFTDPNSYSNKVNANNYAIKNINNIPIALKESFKENRSSNQYNVVLYSANNSNWESSFDKIRKEANQNKCYYTKTDIGAEFRRRKFNGTVGEYKNGRISVINFEETT